MPQNGNPYQTEAWIEYGIGMCIFFLRFYARWKVVGAANLALDDLFAFFAMVLFTVDSAVVQVINDNGSFIGLNEQTAAALSDEVAAQLETGSKALFVAWISYTTLIWCLKASLLFFYSRLTLGLWQQKLVKVMGALCVVAYTAVILTLFLHCTPIQKNWQIKPYAGDKCTLTYANYIVIAALNVLTDAGILTIPLPLVWKVKIPLRRKLVIGLLLSSGLFVITAALLRCILSLRSVTQINNSTQWGIRETFVSLIAVQAPAIKPLFNKSHWAGSSKDNKATGSSGFQRFGRNQSVRELSAAQSAANFSLGGGKSYDVESGTNTEFRKGSVTPLSDVELNDISRHGSKEQIIQNSLGKGAPLEIKVTTVYALADESGNEPEASGKRSDSDDEGAISGPRSNNPFRAPTPRKDEGWRTRGGNLTEISGGEGNSGKASRMLGKGSSPN